MPINVVDTEWWLPLTIYVVMQMSAKMSLENATSLDMIVSLQQAQLWN
jgi:hypothetical protein